MKRPAPRLALIKDGGRKVAVYEGRKHLATYDVAESLDASIVEEARTWGVAPPPRAVTHTQPQDQA